MEIVTKEAKEKSALLDQIAEGVENAKKAGKVIDHIKITKEEQKEVYAALKIPYGLSFLRLSVSINGTVVDLEVVDDLRERK